MIIYLTVLAVAFLLSQSAVQSYYDQPNLQLKKVNEINPATIAVIVLLLSVVAGIRNYVGTDFSTYKGLFQWYATIPLVDAFSVGEGLFWGMSCLVGKVTGNVTWVFFFFALCIAVCEIPTVMKYTTDAPLSMFLYITTMQYYAAFNGIRQSMAAALMFAVFPLLLEKKWVKYFLCLYIAYHIHNSVILLAPIAIAATMNTRKTMPRILYAVTFIVVFLFPGLVNLVMGSLTPDNYMHFLVIDPTDDGVNILRVLVAFMPVMISLFFYTRLERQVENKRLFQLLVNFSIINFMILILASRSTVLARFSFYTSIYNVLLIPYFLKIMPKSQRGMLKTVIMALFFLYMVMLLPRDSNLLPYRTVFG